MSSHKEGEDERNASELYFLVKRKLLGDQKKACKVIGAATDKYISKRTLQSWMIDREKKSSRKCPVWAIEALKRFVKDEPPKDNSEINIFERNEEVYSDLREKMHFEINEDALLEAAERRIARDELMKKECDNLNFEQLPNTLFEMKKEIRELKKLCFAQKRMLNVAFRDSENFADLKKIYQQCEENYSDGNELMDETITHILEGYDSDEFPGF